MRKRSIVKIFFNIVLGIFLMNVISGAFNVQTETAKINEIMYNPIGNDNNKEFIEIYIGNNQSLKNWIIADLEANDSLQLMVLRNSSFAIIVEEGFDISINNNVSYYSVGATIGNNLNNDHDQIFLFNQNNELIDQYFYDGSLANNNDYSLEFCNGRWGESKKLGGTPGNCNSVCFFNTLNINNSIINTTTNSTINTTINPINNTTTNVTINITTNSITNTTTNSITNTTNTSLINTLNNSITNTTNTSLINTLNNSITNTTTNLITNTSTNVTVINTTISSATIITNNNNVDNCNISIINDKLIYQENEKIRFNFDFNQSIPNYSIEYWVSDFSGTVLKNKIKTSNNNKKTWTPICSNDRLFLINAKLNDCNITYSKLFIFNCSVQYGDCIDSCQNLIVDENPSNNNNKNNDNNDNNGNNNALNSNTLQYDEEINIEKIYLNANDEISFGDVFQVKLISTKGNSAKTLIQAYVANDDETISEITKIYHHSKNSKLEFNIPVFIKPNCNFKYGEGDYNLIVTGLGTEAYAKIKLNGINEKICRKQINSNFDINSQTNNNQNSNNQIKTDNYLNNTSYSGIIDNIVNQGQYITSFYTLSKKYNDQIKLFSNIICPNKCIIELFNEQLNEQYNDPVKIDTIFVKNHTGKIQFNVTKPKSKIFKIKLYTVVDENILSLNYDVPNGNLTETKTSLEETKMGFLDADTESSIGYLEDKVTVMSDIVGLDESSSITKQQNIGKEPHSLIKEQFNSVNYQIKQKIGYLLVGVFGIGLVLVIIHYYRNNYSSPSKK